MLGSGVIDYEILDGANYRSHFFLFLRHVQRAIRALGIRTWFFRLLLSLFLHRHHLLCIILLRFFLMLILLSHLLLSEAEATSVGFTSSFQAVLPVSSPPPSFTPLLIPLLSTSHALSPNLKYQR